MSLLVDTGVVYAHHDRDAARHDAATTALDVVLDGTYGQPYVDDYVYDEAVTLAAHRADHGAAAALGNRIRGRDPYPSVFAFEFVGRNVFFDAADLFERYDDQNLSFTDAVLVAHARALGVDAILSFDDDFDGVYDRLDPVDA